MRLARHYLLVTWKHVSMLVLWLAVGCTSEDDLVSEEMTPERFPCGDNGGSCEVGAEVCMVSSEDGCSTCVALEQSCDASDDCSCLGDIASWPMSCADAPTCEPSEDGLVVRCAPDGWGCA